MRKAAIDMEKDVEKEFLNVWDSIKKMGENITRICNILDEMTEVEE